MFGFNKYEQDAKMNKMLKESLNGNVKNFNKLTLDRLSKNKKAGGKNVLALKDVAFTSEMSVELLRYCIQNNEMFAVHYDRKETEQKE